MKNKVIEETDEFYYLENKLVIPKQKFIVKVNKVILDRSGRIDPHSLINAGNLDFTVEKLLLHQYTRDMRRNAVYISR
ncbi:hypothetical protein HY992_04065, partial [Candidatus Micrarchaeota archaeon]|nr:hypothetical protein [Candidatus Micrarchaeota archaeon]